LQLVRSKINYFFWELARYDSLVTDSPRPPHFHFLDPHAPNGQVILFDVGCTKRKRSEGYGQPGELCTCQDPTLALRVAERERVLAAVIAARPPPAPPRPVCWPRLERPASSFINEKPVVWVQLLPLRLPRRWQPRQQLSKQGQQCEPEKLALKMLQHFRNLWTQRQPQILGGVEAEAPRVAGEGALALVRMQLIKEHMAQRGAGAEAGAGGGRGHEKSWRSWSQETSSESSDEEMEEGG